MAQQDTARQDRGPGEAPPRESAAAVAAAVRRLARAARSGSLATTEPAGGAEGPFVSLVTPALSWDGDLMILVSGLSRHARHLREDPRCSVLLEGAATGANPQTAPRVTLTGRAVSDPTPALRERWVRIHPYGALYAGFADFALWRVEVERLHWVGGFGRVRELAGEALRPGWRGGEVEAGLLEEARRQQHGRLPEAAGIVALDPDGLDLGPPPCGDPEGEARTHRVHFPIQADDPEALLAAASSVLPIPAP